MAKRPTKDPPPTATPTSTTHPTGSQQKAPTMSNGSFEDILNAPVEEFNAPPPVPRGTYIAMVDGPHTEGESSRQKTPFLRFKMKLLSAEADVDAAELAEADSLGKSINYDLYVTADAAFRIKDFLTDLDISLSGKSTREALSEAPGKTCKLLVEQELTKPNDGSEPRLISRARRTSAA